MYNDNTIYLNQTISDNKELLITTEIILSYKQLKTRYI